MFFLSKGVGDPALFTVSLMPFFRGIISKAFTDVSRGPENKERS
jgi:hypothetical protein